MAHLALTGARGFIGWHTRVAASIDGRESVPIGVGDAYDAAAAAAGVSGSERLVHIAGVNRGTDSEVRDGNILFARQAAAAVRSANVPPSLILFTNSSQIGNGSVYAGAKEAAAQILSDAAADVGAEFVDLRLPNIFGEHGRPFYNSVVSTFCHLVATGGTPTIDIDRELTLLHAQDVADVLLGTSTATQLPVTQSTVTALLSDIRRIAEVLDSGVLPEFSSAHERNLVNTYRSFATVDLRRIKVPAGRGEPRTADHVSLNRRSLERLSAARGSATVTLRRPFTVDKIELNLTAGSAVDVPTLWSASVSGTDDLDLRAWHASKAG